MPTKPIELEIRGEIEISEIPTLVARLKKLGFRPLPAMRRTSVMSFGRVTGFQEKKDLDGLTEVDVRCRVTNGAYEVVSKIGQTESHNRLEIGQDVDAKQFLTFARMFGAMGFFTKVGSRMTQELKNGPVAVALVSSASGLSYIELEKMSNPTLEAADLQELTELAKALGVRIWPHRKQFMDFCARLTDRDDWVFKGTEDDLARLKAEVKKTGSGRKGGKA